MDIVSCPITMIMKYLYLDIFFLSKIKIKILCISCYIKWCPDGVSLQQWNNKMWQYKCSPYYHSQSGLRLLIGTTVQCGVMLASIFLLILGENHFIFKLQTRNIEINNIGRQVEWFEK